MSRFAVKIFLSHSTKSFPRGNLLCFRKFRLSEMFMPKRGTSSFPMENFLSPVPKNFVEEPICVSQNFLYRKTLGTRGGGGGGVSVTIFRQNCFCFTVPNHFLEETFCVSEGFG